MKTTRKGYRVVDFERQPDDPVPVILQRVELVQREVLNEATGETEVRYYERHWLPISDEPPVLHKEAPDD